MLDATPIAAPLRIHGGLCLLPGEGAVPADIVCSGRLIAEITHSRRAASAGIDAAGCLVLPGIVDIHGDAFERQIMPRPRTMFPIDLAMRDSDAQLVANGITTAFHGVTVSWEPGLRSAEQAGVIAQSLQRLHPVLKADNRLHVRWETFALEQRASVKQLLEEMPGALLAFNDHTGPRLSDTKRFDAIARAAERAMIPASAYEAMWRDAEARQAEVPGAIAEMARFASARGIAMLSHDDRTLEARAYYRGLGALISEFPVTPEARDAAAAAGDAIVMGAPNVVRGGSHLGAIGAEESIRQSRCSILASDYYYPAPLAAALDLWRRDVLPLDRAWALVSEAPAMAAGLRDRGRIAAGLRADLVVIPVDGHRPLATIAGGRITYRCG